MKRRKGRIILGTTAVAAALTFGGCGGGQSTSPAESNTAVTAQSASTADTAETAETAETAAESKTEDNAGKTIMEIDVFDVNENYNSVVYGPLAED